MASPKKIVVDSSVVVKWLSSQGEEDISQSDKLLKDCEKGKIKLFVPELTKTEIGNAICYKGMDLPQSKITLATLYSLPITFVILEKEQALQTLEISKSKGITYYDGLFISLAEWLSASLVTANPKHQKGSRKIQIIPLKKYGPILEKLSHR